MLARDEGQATDNAHVTATMWRILLIHPAGREAMSCTNFIPNNSLSVDMPQTLVESPKNVLTCTEKTIPLFTEKLVNRTELAGCVSFTYFTCDTKVFRSFLNIFPSN